jgi:hypothetical protein
MNIYLQELDSFVIPNKYTKWYNSLIEKAANRFNIDPSIQIIQNRRRAKKQFGYIEGHHIIPRSIKPELSINHFNIVYLTAKEHFIAHLLLTKMFLGKEKQKMIFAFRRMQHHNNGKRYTSKVFSNFKLQMPPTNLGKIQITDGINTRLHLKFEPMPGGWTKGAGLLYKNARKITNINLHCNTYEVFNIINQDRFLVTNLKEWAVTVNIPYYTLASACRLNNVVRKTFIINKIKT